MKFSTKKACVVGEWLLRAPLLPVSALALGSSSGAVARRRKLCDLPSVQAALALAAPGLNAGREPAGIKQSDAARDRYLARMAFRPTPAGLMAGVAMGELGPRTAIDTGGAHARLGVGRGWLAALGRTLLDDPAVRSEAALRRSPSLCTDGKRAIWLGRGEGAEAPVERTPIDPLLGAVLDATATWTPWKAVRAAAAEAAGLDDPESVDDFLLQLLDAGLLCDDLTPPLIGPPPLGWMAARLRRGAIAPEWADRLETLQRRSEVIFDADAPELGDVVMQLHHDLAELADAPRGAVATLVLRPTESMLDRSAVERAAALAPILFRFAAAFAPTWERATSPALDDAVRALLEAFQPGGFALGDLALGRYGVALGEAPTTSLGAELPPLPSGEGAEWATLPVPLLRLLVEKLAAAGDGVMALTAEGLDAALPPGDVPPTFELHLAPCREPAGALPGSDWLLGLHGPAGSTWGRFSPSLPGLARAFAALREVEAEALPGALLLEVDFAPSAAVADVAGHAPLHEATLALTGWPEGGEVVTPSDLELCVGPALAEAGVSGAPSALGLRLKSGRAVCPLQRARVRSTTVADDGIYRLLVGWSLQRAVAPWALHLGPLAALPRLPRITVDGFVVAPANWRIPDAVYDACAAGDARAAIRSWRASDRVPRRVQVGFEDQLLPLDLDDPAATVELARAEYRDGAARAWEIWPPLDRLVDSAGRRVEAVVAVGLEAVPPSSPVPSRSPSAIAASFSALPSLSASAIAPAWRTFKLFGAPDRADDLLARLAPTIAAAFEDGAIDNWFFLRYLDGPTAHHLRLRLRAVDERRFLRLERRLTERFEEARAAGELVAIERAEYRPEFGRFGGSSTMPLVEEIFASDSWLAVALTGLDPELRPPATDLLVRSFDALGRGLGLSVTERRALSSRSRAQVERLLRPDRSAPDPLAALYRTRQAPLLEALAADGEGRPLDAASTPLAEHVRRLEGLARRADAIDLAALLSSLLPSLLHLAAVRLVGVGESGEAVGYYLWQRALEGLARRR